MPPYCSSCSDGTGAPTTIARNSRPALTVSCGQWVLLAMPRWGTYTAHDHPTKERTHKRARNYSSFSSWQLRYVDISDTRIPQESPAISFNETQGRATRVQEYNSYNSYNGPSSWSSRRHSIKLANQLPLSAIEMRSRVERVELKRQWVVGAAIN